MENFHKLDDFSELIFPFSDLFTCKIVEFKSV